MAAGSLRVIWWKLYHRSSPASLPSTDFFWSYLVDSNNVNNPGSLPGGGGSLVQFGPLVESDQRMRGGPGRRGELWGVSSPGARRMDGMQAVGGMRSLG